jgi:hypothetical protein
LFDGFGGKKFREHRQSTRGIVRHRSLLLQV